MSASFQAALRPPQEEWFAAASEDNAPAVFRLLEARVDPNGVDATGNSALHIAAYNGATEVVRMLRKVGANINARNKQRMTPLMMAAVAGHDFILEEFLIDDQLEMNARDNAGASALHHAATTCNASAVNVLLNAGLPVDATDDHGYTSIMYAARSGQVLTAAALIDAGADIARKSEIGFTAVDLALRFGFPSVYDFLRKFVVTSCEKEYASAVTHSEEVFAADSEICVPAEDSRVQEVASVLEMLRSFHAAEENRSPEFARQVKQKINDLFVSLAGDIDRKISFTVLRESLPLSIDERIVPDESVDQRRFAIILTALATGPSN
jgi:hypothetical protein